MIKYILKRLLQMIPRTDRCYDHRLFLSYLMPGDPVLNQMPDNYTQEQYDEVQHEMGLISPFWSSSDSTSGVWSPGLI